MIHSVNRFLLAFLAFLATVLGGQMGMAQTPEALAHPADLAFEQGRWQEAIEGYRALLAENPDDRLSWLRIAQAERELGRHAAALETLEQARAAEAPEAMVELERARNLLALGRRDEALAAVEAADHFETRARTLLEASPDFDPIRDDRRFQRSLQSVRNRVSPCLHVPEAAQFDFWLGRWEVRAVDGTLVGHATVAKSEGGCSIVERWERVSGSGGTSLSFFVPSRGQWRHVWTGSGGTLIDVTGGLRESGEMHMEGTLEYMHPESVVAFRATWTPLSAGRVRQRMEAFDLAAQTWVVWFDGIFRPLDDEH